MSNLYANGDIHGQIHMLEALVERAPFKEEDEIVFLCDSIDRGRDKTIRTSVRNFVNQVFVTPVELYENVNE